MFEETLEIIIDTTNTTTKTISISKDIVIRKDSVEIARQKHRCAFYPGQIEEVKRYMGMETSPEITYLKSIWTPEVIAAYADMLAQNDI